MIILPFGGNKLCALRGEPEIKNDEFGYYWDGYVGNYRLFKSQEATVESMCNPDDVIEPNRTYYTIYRTWWGK